MKQVRKVLGLFGGLDRGIFLMMVPAALLDTLEGFGILLISSTVLNLLGEGADLRSVLTVTLSMAVGYGFLYWLRSFAASRKDERIARLGYRYKQYVTEKIFRVPFEKMETEEFVNTLNQIRQNDRIYGLTGSILNRMYSIIKSLFAMAVSFVSFVRLSGVAGQLGDSAFLVGMLFLLLVLLVLASMGYMSWREKQNAKMMTRIMQDVVKYNSVAMQLSNDVIAEYSVGKHIRIYGMQEKILREERKNIEGMSEVMRHFYRLELKPGIMGSASSVTISGLIYLMVGAIAMAGGLGIGSIVWYAGVVQQFLEAVHQVITLVSTMYNECIRQQAVFALEEAGEEEGEGITGIRPLPVHEFRFEDVSFAYPESDRMILKHVNLCLSGREHVALVGTNGCGKTTLIKLLCRLYDPTEGRILLDGVDIREIPREEYMEMLSVVFQDYQIFAATLAENIALCENIDRRKAAAAVEKTGLGIRELDISLCRDLDSSGIEVSGGEGQKTAIARALYKDAPVVILDEPTAALDPISESEIYEKFNVLVEGKLAVFISHRLSSCRFCDRILVLQDGQVVQDGTHEELTARKDGLYSRMWEAQRQYYVEQAAPV